MGMTTRPFNYRGFVAAMACFSGMGLPVTGIVNHFHGLAPVTVERHAWMSAHNILGLLFVVFCVWHAVLNRRALWNHMRSGFNRIPGVSREAILAGTVVALALLIFVGHAFHAGH